MYALNIGTDGRVLSATIEQFSTDSMQLVDDLPEGNICDYKYIDGDYVYEPIPTEDPEIVEKSIEEQILDLKAQMDILMQRLESGG